MSVEFIDNSIAVKNAIRSAAIKWLYEAAGEIQGQTMRNTRVDSGDTKQSWQYKVDEAALKATIGSNLQNAIWEEFGTGQYALKGDGRKTPWSYQDKNGRWHTTKGKKPSRAFYKAYTMKKSQVKKAFENSMRGLK